MVASTINNKKDSIYIYPTDTVWGIGGNIYSRGAYRKICKIKSSGIRPFSILFSDYEMLISFFNFPHVLTQDWLKDFFSYESTLTIPKNWAKVEIPSWITQESPFVAIRCLEYQSIKRIINQENAPITTTSLNRSGDSPIVSFEKALNFYHKIKDDNVNFIEDEKIKCSGNSSTIILYEDTTGIKFLRRGRFAADIEKHCRLLTT